MAVDDGGTATACLIFLFVVPFSPAGLRIEANAISIRTDHASNALAGIGRQEVSTSAATILAARFVLVANFLLRKLRHLSGLVVVPLLAFGSLHADLGEARLLAEFAGRIFLLASELRRALAGLRSLGFELPMTSGESCFHPMLGHRLPRRGKG